MEPKQLKVLVWFVGTRGDVLPGVALCKALQDRGHEVAMGVTPGPEECIRAYGIRAITLGTVAFKLRDDTHVMSQEELEIFRRSTNPREYLVLEHKYGITWNGHEAMPDSLRACRDLMQKEHFDAIVSTVITSGAAVRLLKMFPHLKIIRSAFSFGSFAPPTRAFPPGGYADSPQCYGFLNKLKHFHFLLFRFIPFLFKSNFMKQEMAQTREIEGIDHDEGFSVFQTISELPELGLWSPTLQEKPSDFPVNHVVTGCLFVPKLDGWTPSEALEAFMQKRDSKGRKPAVITFGSMMGVEKVQGSVLRACQQLGMNVVNFVPKTTKQRENTKFSFTESSPGGEAGTGVFELDYAPFDWLLPLASVVICHGGAGTTFRSLWAGAPVVVCPIFSQMVADQVSHGQFVERKGLGTWIEPLAPSVQQCQVAIEQALRCKERCAEVSAKMQEEDGAAVAAAEVERFALQPKVKESTCCIA
ncbi:ATG26 [Symbiodinium natans]|uniref:ATG26 protein n=1 Tax=Symbiodinium natans TaxID=878477 RepID=A0A812SHZ9_9DINO|nr:ATG26 [Symbiodinium natans]